VLLTANASDTGSGVEKVRFWVGSTYLGYDGSAPYSKSWNTATVPNGRHVVTFRALDWAGNVTTRTITVTVINPDTTPPAISITAPAAGSEVSGITSITADASDSQGLQKVRFWAGSQYLGYDTTAPYTVLWNSAASPNGIVVLRADAVDWANNITGTTHFVFVTD
jgi:hypothetical protein